MRYTPPAPAAPELLLRPRIDHSVALDESPLPAWGPRPPRGGWTPEQARTAAELYARDAVTADRTLARYGVERITKAAYFELRRSTAGLHGADLVDRLQRARAADPELVADEPPPF